MTYLKKAILGSAAVLCLGYITLSGAKLVFKESSTLPISIGVHKGAPEFQRRFDELNKAIPLRKKEVFQNVEDAQSYIDDYVLPRLYYISDRGWISEDPKLVGYYRKNWKDSNDLLERTHSSNSWSVDLIRNPYEMIRQKISLSAAKLVFGEN